MTDVPPRTEIRDRFGRVFDYLRVAVTEACNLRCVYCMPPEGVDFKAGEHLLSADELLRVVRVAAGLGVTKVRLTGGEPLVRKEIGELVAGMVRVPGVESVHLTTNGVLLRERADGLLAAGLRGLNVSLDSLREERFLQITRRPGAGKVLESVRHALALGFPSVKVNVVVMRGFNDDELLDFAALTRTAPLTVRFIELMPFDEHQVWKRGRYFGSELIVARLREAHPDLAAESGSSTEEHVYRLPGHAGKVAVIPSYTRSLCGSCNRIRLTADGCIRNCLYSGEEHDLRPLLRGGATDEELGELICHAMRQKLVDGWAAQKASQSGPPRTSMTQIGG
ncbi:MAG: GTP 3',8-cyclase MoaA [Deltaproteobacteria bacterium]|nr:GTP 3',8-cyclase MoaA [Deltaproteobacteria bacterium]